MHSRERQDGYHPVSIHPLFFSMLWRLLVACMMTAALAVTLGRALASGVQVAYLRASGAEFADGIYALDVERQLTTALLRSTPASPYPFDLSLDGTRIAFSRVEGNEIKLYIAILKDGSIHPLTDDSKLNLMYPRWSPDGQRLVFECDDGTHVQVCIANADGTDFRTLTASTDADFRSPAWSPDGMQIVVASDNCGSLNNLCVFPVPSSADSPSPIRGLLRRDKGIYTPVWSPDGQTIAFRFGSFMDLTFGIYLLNTQDGDLNQLTSRFGISPAWSPDGAWLAFARWERSHYDVYIMRVDGSGLRRLTTDRRSDLFPVWMMWR